MYAKMAASVIRVLLICFISLAYSDDFLPYGWTQSGFKHKISSDVSLMVFFLAILDVNLA